MTLEQDLGNKIRSLRTLKGLSQENMAEMLGISAAAFSKIERGETDVNISRLHQIAHSLKVSIADLLNFGEKISNSFNNSNGSGTLIVAHESKDLIIEIERLRAESSGQKREIEHLKKIVSLLEEKKSTQAH